MSYLELGFPLLSLLAICAAFVGRNTWRSRLLVLPAVTLFLFGWPPAATLAARVLEARYQRVAPDALSAQAIVVLASSVLPPVSPHGAPILGADTLERCRYAAWLYHNRLQVPVLASGRGSFGEAPYSQAMRQALIGMGVPDSMIWTEEESRSTRENALNSTKLLEERAIRRIVLVTSAWHMLRAEKSFRKCGVQVVPAACDFRSDLSLTVEGLMPARDAVSRNEDSLHEAGGLAWYALRGWI